MNFFQQIYNDILLDINDKNNRENHDYLYAKLNLYELILQADKIPDDNKDLHKLINEYLIKIDKLYFSTTNSYKQLENIKKSSLTVLKTLKAIDIISYKILLQTIDLKRIQILITKLLNIKWLDDMVFLKLDLLKTQYSMYNDIEITKNCKISVRNIEQFSEKLLEDLVILDPFNDDIVDQLVLEICKNDRKI